MTVMRYEEMKDSGVPWIGEMPEHWTTKRGKYAATIFNGCPFDSDNFSKSNGFPLIRIRDITSGRIETFYDGEFDTQFIIHNNTVLVGMDGDFPIRFWQNGAALLNQRCCAIFEQATFDKKYIFYSLPFGLRIINDLAYSTTVKHLSNSDINNFLFPAPPLQEQTAIASYLDDQCGQIDDIISSTKSVIEEYKQWKDSVIFEAVTKGLDPSVPMKDSGVEWIGEIPDHWNFIQFRRILNHSNGSAIRVGPFGSSLSSKDYRDDGIIVYNQRSVLDDEFRKGNVFISQEKATELNSFSVYPGDILITTRGTIGKISFVPDNASYGILHPCIIRFRIDETLYSKSLLKFLFNEGTYAKDQFLRMSNATTLDVIYSESLKSILIPFLPIDEQTAIADYLDTRCAEIDSIIAEKESLIADLESYKKSLIYETVTGKRKVA